jgi:hypothetical protein
MKLRAVKNRGRQMMEFFYLYFLSLPIIRENPYTILTSDAQWVRLRSRSRRVI